MTQPDHDPVRRWGCAAFMLYCAFILGGIVVLAVSLCGCTRTVYTPVESVRAEYRDRDVERVVTDTMREERFVLVKGDTVWDWRDRWHVQREYVHDTVSVIRTDTVREPYPVERPLSRWEQTKMDFGGAAIGGIVIALCTAVVWLVKRFRK